MNVLKWILYLAALGGFIWFVFFREFNPFVGTDNPPLVTDISSDSSAYTESEIDTTSYVYETDSAIEETYVEEVEPFIEEETPEPKITEEVDVVDNTPTETPTTGIQLSDRYLVVVGSFGSKANANKLEKSLKNKGMEVTQTKIRNLNRVVIASATDEASAEVIKSDYIQKTGASAFVLEQ